VFNAELNRAVESFAAVMFPLAERDLEREWVWKDHDEEGIRFTFFVTIQELRGLAVALSSRQTPLTPAQQILGQYHAQYMDLQAAVFSLSEADADRVPAEGEWQVRSVYSHMLGADIGFSAVVRYALEEHRAGKWSPERMSDADETRVMGMSEEKYNELVQGSFQHMLAFHRDFHPKIIQEFSTITDTELDLPSTFWEETRFPIRHRLHRFEAHLIQHTVQIDKTLAAINSGPSETKRLIRYLFSALAAVNAQLIAGDERSSRCSELAGTIESRTREIEKIIP
jgi:hypothetical protein